MQWWGQRSTARPLKWLRRVENALLQALTRWRVFATGQRRMAHSRARGHGVRAVSTWSLLPSPSRILSHMLANRADARGLSAPVYLLVGVLILK